jgi:phosphoribosylaminoimidazole-succinocarboxamide synthase
MDLERILTKENFVYSGKSKDIYRIPEGEFKGKYAFVFSDRGTGYLDENNKPVFDPGYDYVVGEIPGKGAIVCRFVTYFFRLLQAQKVPTHYIATVSDNVMIVEPATPLSLPEQAPEFAARGLHVIDGKIEVGRLKSGDGKIVLIDEISPDVLRVCKGYSADVNEDCRLVRECIETSYADDVRKISGKNVLTAAQLEKIFLQ